MAKNPNDELAEQGRRLITDPGQMPDLSSMSWEEEDQFWATHDFAEGVLDEGPEVDAEFYKTLGIERPEAQRHSSFVTFWQHAEPERFVDLTWKTASNIFFDNFTNSVQSKSGKRLGSTDAFVFDRKAGEVSFVIFTITKERSLVEKFLIPYKAFRIEPTSHVFFLDIDDDGLEGLKTAEEETLIISINS